MRNRLTFIPQEPAAVATALAGGAHSAEWQKGSLQTGNGGNKDELVQRISLFDFFGNLALAFSENY